MSKSCKECGFENEMGSNFCSSCGSKLSSSSENINEDMTCYYIYKDRRNGPFTQQELLSLVKHSYIEPDTYISIDNQKSWLRFNDWQKTYNDEDGNIKFVDFDIINPSAYNWMVGESFSKARSNKFYSELMNYPLKSNRDYEILLTYFITRLAGFVLTNYHLIIIDDTFFTKTKVIKLERINNIFIDLLDGGKNLVLEFKEDDTKQRIKYKISKRYTSYIIENIEIIKLMIDINKKRKDKSTIGRLTNEINRLEKLIRDKTLGAMVMFEPTPIEKIRIRALNLKSTETKLNNDIKYLN